METDAKKILRELLEDMELANDGTTTLEEFAIDVMSSALHARVALAMLEGESAVRFSAAKDNGQYFNFGGFESENQAQYFVDKYLRAIGYTEFSPIETN